MPKARSWERPFAARSRYHVPSPASRNPTKWEPALKGSRTRMRSNLPDLGGFGRAGIGIACFGATREPDPLHLRAGGCHPCTGRGLEIRYRDESARPPETAIVAWCEPEA